ncbi:MAG: hypothetical protein WKF60_04075 [Ilumatobacter sp.]
MSTLLCLHAHPERRGDRDRRHDGSCPRRGHRVVLVVGYGHPDHIQVDRVGKRAAELVAADLPGDHDRPAGVREGWLFD